MRIPGLPEGVELVEVLDAPRGCNPDEYSWSGGIRQHPVYGFGAVIVRPSEGFEFVYDIGTDEYQPVRKFSTPKTILAKFALHNTKTEMEVKALLRHCPGLVSIEEQP